MMSKKQWSALLCLHIAYLFLGASIFYHIESPLELENKLEELRERIEIEKLLRKNYLPDNPPALQDILEKLSEFCGKPMANVSDTEVPVILWDFYHSFFFSYTVVSTIGYGNLAPTTSGGRIIMIFYAIVGIPLNAILFANLGEYFGVTFRGLYTRYKNKNPSSGSNIDYFFHRFGLVGRITVYLAPGFLFFIFLPAGLFVIFEGWDYTLAVYYAFVTLTTIGFGDYVAGMADRGFGGYFIAYKIFLIFWITFGLGYLVMVIGFLTQGLRSKKMKNLERKLAQNLKVTQSKIWNGVTKDVSYLRKILNEVYLMRFKPVYNDEIPPPIIHRSSSCPNLTFTREDSPQVARRRAVSEAQPFGPYALPRVQSDSDLLAIDRTRTFATGSQVQPSELLARVVDALGTMQNEENNRFEDGFHGFSDEEILASEKAGSGWSLGGEKMFALPPPVLRARAVSEIRGPVTQIEDEYSNGDWTWSGPTAADKVKELQKLRRNGKLSVPNVSSFSRQSESAASDYSNAPKTIFSKLNPFKKHAHKRLEVEKNMIISPEPDGMTPAEYLRKTARGRASMAAPMSSYQKYLNSTQSGRSSGLTQPESDSMTPAEYLRKTARGRASMAVPMSSYQKYLNNTQSGRSSGLTQPESDSMTPAEYLRKTARGRASMAAPMSSHQRYLNSTQSGRSSGLTPPKSDSMTPAEYLRKTARGRASMAAPMSSYQKYLNNTQSGRSSGLTPPEPDSMTPAEYLRKTARGRASIAAPMSSHQRYLNSTQNGRASRISLPSQCADDVLEQTTIADLIRALESLHTGSSSPPRRKYGTASLTPPRDPPPLLRLFAPSTPQPRRASVYQTGGRRMSATPAAALQPPLARRRTSLHPSSAAKPSQFTPTLVPLVSGDVSPARRPGQQPPPYSALDIPRRRPPRQSMWGPAISHPSSPVPRRARCESLTEVKIDDLK